MNNNQVNAIIQYNIVIKDKLKKYNNDVENFMETLENRFINLRMDLESKNEKLSKQINLMNRSFKNNDPKHTLYVKCMDTQDKCNEMKKILENLVKENLKEYDLEKVIEQQQRIQTVAKGSECLANKIKKNKSDIAKLMAFKEQLKKQHFEMKGKVQNIPQLKIKRDELKKQVDGQECLIAPFRRQLEQYQKEQQELLQQKLYTQTELELLLNKHSEMLGVHNHTEKIKHLIELKKLNYELEQINLTLLQKLRQQENVCKKIQKDYLSPKEDKK